MSLLRASKPPPSTFGVHRILENLHRIEGIFGQVQEVTGAAGWLGKVVIYFVASKGSFENICGESEVWMSKGKARGARRKMSKR